MSFHITGVVIHKRMLSSWMRQEFAVNPGSTPGLNLQLSDKCQMSRELIIVVLRTVWCTRWASKRGFQLMFMSSGLLKRQDRPAAEGRSLNKNGRHDYHHNFVWKTLKGFSWTLIIKVYDCHPCQLTNSQEIITKCWMNVHFSTIPLTRKQKAMKQYLWGNGVFQQAWENVAWRCGVLWFCKQMESPVQQLNCQVGGIIWGGESSEGDSRDRK